MLTHICVFPILCPINWWTRPVSCFIAADYDVIFIFPPFCLQLISPQELSEPIFDLGFSQPNASADVEQSPKMSLSSLGNQFTQRSTFPRAFQHKFANLTNGFKSTSELLSSRTDWFCVKKKATLNKKPVWTTVYIPPGDVMLVFQMWNSSARFMLTSFPTQAVTKDRVIVCLNLRAGVRVTSANGSKEISV